MPDIDADLLIDAAARIGTRLVATALWQGDVCTWDVAVPDRTTSQPRRTISAPADGDLYQGTAGMALFLGELWAITGTPDFLHCARAAIRQSDRCRERRGVSKIGLHDGDAGVALVAARMAVLTSDDEWTDVVERHLSGMESEIVRDNSLDVIGGAAGAVLALLQIHDYLGDQRAASLAVRLGDHLLRRASRRSYGWSWNGGLCMSKQDLCGYAHGASGIAHAFLELFAHTGDRQWRFAAARAMEYERHWSSHGSGDWPDFRCRDLGEILQSGGPDALRFHLRRGGKPPQYEPTSMRAWCHGSPGISLARIRAVTLGVDASLCKSELVNALRVIHMDLERPQRGNCSLCHGSFGNAECLLIAAQQLGDVALDSVTLLASQSVERFEMQGRRWPAGVAGGGPDPSLMLGEAGIGHVLLRIAGCPVPSAVCISSWKLPVPVAEDDGDFVQSETSHLLRHFFPVLRRLKETSALGGHTEYDGIGLRTVGGALQAIIASIAAAKGPNAEWLRDALSVDLAWLAEEAAFDDFISDEVRHAGRPDASEVDWKTVRFYLPASAKIVRTRWAWREWLEEGDDAPAEREDCFLLYRQLRSVHVQPVTLASAVVLEALRTPATIETVICTVLALLAPDPVINSSIPRFVTSIVRNAVTSGIVDIWQPSDVAP